MLVMLLLAIGWVQGQEYRPVSLADLVKAVGSNRDGLDDVDLTPFVADHAIFAGQAIGFAARVRQDPAGPILVAWRRTGELWQYRWLDEAALEGVTTPAGEGVPLGRVEGLRELGARVVLETRAAAAAGSALTTVVMAEDLAPRALVVGTAKASVPSGAVIVQRDRVEGGLRSSELVLLDPDTRRISSVYTARAPGRHAAISSLRYDAGRDALTFVVTLRAEPSASSERAGASDVVTNVTCTAIGAPAPRCG
jgi:hypothetical protein